MSLALLASTLIASAPLPTNQCVEQLYIVHSGSELIESKSLSGNCGGSRAHAPVRSKFHARGKLLPETTEAFVTQVCTDIEFYFQDEANRFKTPFYCSDHRSLKAALSEQEELTIDIYTTVRRF